MNEHASQTARVDPAEIFKPASDTFMAAVPWTKNRTVVVFRRERNGREYVRCRTFNRHQIKKVWYPSPRFYMVPVDCAEELGKAIIAAAKGETHGDPPGWWFDFIKQYEAGEWRDQPTAEHIDDSPTALLAEIERSRSAATRLHRVSRPRPTPRSRRRW